ncbi:MAG TPA: dockerin type I domain-containing protein [Syntrophomonadaceae bacterium]|nr:dockerin type I domain-containing protein [Syntrophomonadaceae bacterium]
MKTKQGFNRMFFILLLIPLLLIMKPFSHIEASQTTYKVYNLKLSDDKKSIVFGESIMETTSFDEAITQMKKYDDGVITSDKSPSPLKIVAATRGQAHSYPYRAGKNLADVILNIYTNKALSSAHTYIPAHYLMYVYDYSEREFNGVKRIIAEVEIQGGKGYVEVNKLDIIPLIYMERGIAIELGGNEDHYKNPEKSYKYTAYQETYYVEENKDHNINEIRVKACRPHSSQTDINLAYAIAPDDLGLGQYYSPDGIHFFGDNMLKKRVGKDFYAYFQWLPLRTMTNHSPESFEKLLRYYNKDDSVMIGQTHHFIEQGLKYGMNPVFIFQQANLESAYGTSKYARERNNLFGWGAGDSDPDKAHTYDNIGEAIGIHMKSQIAGYMDVGDWRHYGPSFGNKSAGINVKYASDPYYGLKVASMYYRMDKLNSFKDYNAYDLSLLENGTSYSVKKDKSTNSEWYKTKSGLKNQVIVNLGVENDRIRTTLWMPNFEGISYPKFFPLNLFEEHGYIPDKGVTPIASNGKKGNLPQKPKGWTPPKKQIEYGKKANAVTTGNVNFRESHTTASKIITTLTKGTTLIVEPTDIGWARTTYNGKTGYVSMTYLEIEKEKAKYKLGDINGDGVINSIDGIRMKKYLANEIRLSSTELKAADINKDGKVNSIDGIRLKKHLANEKLIGE